MVVEVDKECEIKFNLLVSGANVEFSVVDENIAIVNNNLVVGKKVGVTLLNATLTYGESSFSAFAQVKVVENNDANNQDKDDNQDDNNPDGNGDKVPGISDEPGIVVKSLYYKITPINNCKYEDSTLYIGETSSFILDFYINLDQTIAFDYNEINIIVPEGIKIERELNHYLITAQNDGFIYIVFPEKGYNVTINFELIKNM